MRQNLYEGGSSAAMIPALQMSRIRHHVFVCQNDRPEGGKPSCAARGSARILSAFQKHAGADPELWGDVAVTSSGCLGPCFEGPTVLVYPEGVWYCGLAQKDVPEIVESHFKGGRPVSRLWRKWDE